MEILEQEVPMLNNLIVDDDTKSVIQWANPSLNMHHNYSIQEVCYTLIRDTFAEVCLSHVKIYSPKLSRELFFLHKKFLHF